MKGRFITLEGIDGVGKSTQVAHVRALLDEAGIEHVATREPGGTPLAEEIRGLLLNKRDESVAGLTELLLMFAARNQHLAGRILPALNAGVWVVSERFTDATYAYQAGGRGMDGGTVAQLEGMVQRGMQPDLTLYLDAPPDTAAGRRAERAGDRFEGEGGDFFQRVRAGYWARAKSHPRITAIDASLPPAEVSERITSALGPLIAAHAAAVPEDGPAP